VDELVVNYEQKLTYLTEMGLRQKEVEMKGHSLLVEDHYYQWLQIKH